MICSHHLSAILTVQPHLVNTTAAALLNLMKRATQDANLQAVAEASFTFQPAGISAVLVLEESHVALHLWTECSKVTVDIHVCDYQQDNLPKAEQLAEQLSIALTEGYDRTDWQYLFTTG